MESLSQIYEEEITKKWQATTNAHTKGKKIVLSPSVWRKITKDWNKCKNVYSATNYHNRDKNIIEDAKARRLQSYFLQMLEEYFIRENNAEIELDEIHNIFQKFLKYKGIQYTFFLCNTQNTILLAGLPYKHPTMYTYKQSKIIPDKCEKTYKTNLARGSRTKLHTE